MTPTDYASLQAQIIAHEGMRLAVYDDATGKPIVPGSVVKGHPTIAAGVKLDAPDGLTTPEAAELTDHRIVRAIGAVSAALPWSEAQSFAVQRVLYDIAFNAGVEGLLGFHKMLAAIQAGDLVTAGREVINSQLAPNRAQRLAKLLQGQDTPV